MGISLMTDVKDNLVLRCVVNIVESDNQLDSSEAWAEVSRVDGAAFNHVLTDLLAEFLQLLDSESLDVCRGVDLVEICICCVVHRVAV